jgi:hypothetical protein
MILEMRNEKIVKRKLLMWVEKPLIDSKNSGDDRDHNRSPRLLYRG